MRKHTLMMSALTLSLALPAAALADTQSQGRGNGHGQDQTENGRANSQGRGGQDRAERSDVRGRGHAERDDDRGNGQGRDGGNSRDRTVVVARVDDSNGRGQGRGADNGNGTGTDRAVVVVRDDSDFRDVLRDLEGRDPRERQDAMREFERRLDGRDLRVVRNRDGDDYIVLIRDDDRGLIDGCPPGLAWRNNGCLPPGQARQAQTNWYDNWLWNRGGDDVRYSYANGYVYQTRQDGGLAGWLPVLAGALGLNNIWPQQYRYEPVPQYYSSYYGLGDRYDYRYADGVVYGLDPQSNRIQQVTALLTGQQWSVGQRMPRGYDAYNVPYAYRTQYRDTPDSWYRYNDGYVYQVDPTTQLVQAVIQLLT